MVVSFRPEFHEPISVEKSAGVRMTPALQHARMGEKSIYYHTALDTEGPGQLPSARKANTHTTLLAFSVSIELKSPCKAIKYSSIFPV